MKWPLFRKPWPLVLVVGKSRRSVLCFSRRGRDEFRWKNRLFPLFCTANVSSLYTRRLKCIMDEAKQLHVRNQPHRTAAGDALLKWHSRFFLFLSHCYVTASKTYHTVLHIHSFKCIINNMHSLNEYSSIFSKIKSTCGQYFFL